MAPDPSIPAESGEHPRAPLAWYRTHAEAHQEALDRARRDYARISSLRLLAFLLGTGLSITFVYHGIPLPALVSAGLAVAAFLVMVARHNRVARLLVVERHLRDVNGEGEARMTGNWKDFPDRGEEFAVEDHAYANDLDLFGRASLFQWLGCAETRLGRARLARWLKEPPAEGGDIAARQGMVGELARRVGWRQSFQAAGREVAKAKEDPDSLLGWAEAEGGPGFSGPAILALRAWAILGPLSVLGLFFLSPFPTAALLPVLLNAWMIRRYQASARPLLASLMSQRKNLESYRGLLVLIETAGFAQGGLAAIAARLVENGRTASARIEELRIIADWVAVRENPLIHVPLNAAFLWDLQWLVNFRRWKSANGKALRIWLDAVAEVEALASLAVVRFENPDWCFPRILPEASRFEAAELGHPLIPAGSGVRNDFALGTDERAVVLTGSNMTGKSTLLRSVGINLILAGAGAPVCAARLKTGLFRVHTSMRLRDDLDKGVSSFYAELLRIRAILEACRRGEKVLFLIDEIFRGTNSADRIAGATGLLVQLVRLGAVGMVSTHDLELGRLEEMHPGRFRNFHFEESFADGRIHFDYRLRPGLSRTRNARHLMRLAGLDDVAAGDEGGPPG